ncbi:ATPase domain-containing protein [Noviherbaspirillum denitrificans]|uniref:non-specific serine/threonine protein kinase n=1 Tax=Noviherbaspirillum denitrificans TaxID=1968433 RepID=A0A254TJP4_9BURK|nr:ATPase domain-containing protein [Noviherbaspirillum denitrificans]OWW19928.1 circadian clock protein KaiC [Noviherbaspirillum denitrificans]
MAQQNISTSVFLSSGISGLDDILRGGFTRDRLYLIEGAPGSGKTTLGLQFLVEGARLGEPVLYITLSETKTELQAVAASHEMSLDGIHIHEVLPPESILNPEEQYTIFHPTDVEMSATAQEILSVTEEIQPTRIVLDSLSELQLLASNSLMYRRQVLALKQYFANRSCTALLLDDRTAGNGDLQVRSIAHGVLSLDRMATDYGGIRRRIEVIKYRGIAFREGVHDYKIQHGGIVVYPRLIAAESRETLRQAQFGSGLPELDQLLGGGIEEGTSTLISGPPGTGKSSLAAQFVSASLKRQERAALFLFEESTSTFLSRADSLGIELRSHLSTGQLSLMQIDPAQLTPGEFIHQVCRIASQGAKIVVIDSLNGFLHAMPNEKLLATHLHELLTYLGQRGVLTFLIGVQQGMLGSNMSTTVDASYIADNVIMLRYFEARGEVQQAISIFKKRVGRHERTIRQLRITSSGIEVGPVLKQFRGVLTGVPKFDPGTERDYAPHD